MDASRVLSLRIARIGGGRYLWIWISYYGVRVWGAKNLLTYDNPTRKLGEIALIVKGPKLVVILQFWLKVDWYRRYCFEKALIFDEDRRYPETVGLYYDTILKKATSTSKMVDQQASPGYSHLPPSLLPHLS